MTNPEAMTAIANVRNGEIARLLYAKNHNKKKGTKVLNNWNILVFNWLSSNGLTDLRNSRCCASIMFPPRDIFYLRLV